MNLLTPLRRPEYAFRPSQILRRLRYANLSRQSKIEVAFPWELPVLVNPCETIGRAICTVGLDDLPVSEIIWRMIRRGSVVVDVGANIGQMTSIMACRTGSNGTVFAFEPNPDVFQQLNFNVHMWQDRGSIAKFYLFDYAVSSTSGWKELFLPDTIYHNHGIASLEKTKDYVNKIFVNTTTLDEMIGNNLNIDLVKIDVEGHESMVVDGMRRILLERRVKNIVFEEHNRLPSRLCDVMSANGFQCYVIARSFWGPRLVRIEEAKGEVKGHATSILATREPTRVREVLKRRGWFALRGDPSQPDDGWS